MTQPAEKTFPDIIIHVQGQAPLFHHMFNSKAGFCDLNAYEKLCPGFGRRLWECYQEDVAHHALMEEMRAKLARRQALLPVEAVSIFERLKARVLSPFGP